MAKKKSASKARPKRASADLIYLNGIDPDTGHYAIPPMPIDELAKHVRAHPGEVPAANQRGKVPRAFAAQFGVDMTSISEVGWAIVFPEGCPKKIRDAMAPLIEHRRKQAKDLVKVLDYKKGEQTRDWYSRNRIAVGTFEAAKVPYYLLLAGPPTTIPFEFEYLISVEYAVGRLAFDTPSQYAQYAEDVVAYETSKKVANAKEIVYWGTQHPGDPATELSATMLIDPLANGVAGAAGSAKTPVHERVGYARTLLSGKQAVRSALINTLHAKTPPAVLFTASHGMAIKSGDKRQVTDNGALLSQDWQGFGGVNRTDYLAAADIDDKANVRGLVAFLFACYGGGTPDTDQFVMDLADAGKAPPIAPEPFVAALPSRLLAHPNGSALAVVGHVDRAWSFSIQPTNATESHIGPFYNGLCFVLSGCPVGHAIAQQFGQKYAALSAALLSAISPTTPSALRPPDRDLVNFWLERNDAQNYVVLGDPAVRIRTDALA
jgi:hypothetical protein